MMMREADGTIHVDLDGERMVVVTSEEGIIVDMYDDDEAPVATFSNTWDEFADLIHSLDPLSVTA